MAHDNRHDSQIRSDLLPMGMGRVTAEKFANALDEALRQMGDTFETCYAAHRGRRDGATCDRVSVTSPGGWKHNHEAGSTVKVRGCTWYRKRARALAPAIAAGMGLNYAGKNPQGEWV